MFYCLLLCLKFYGYNFQLRSFVLYVSVMSLDPIKKKKKVMSLDQAIKVSWKFSDSPVIMTLFAVL